MPVATTSPLSTLLHCDKPHFTYHVPSQPWRAAHSCRQEFTARHLSKCL